MSLLKLQRNNKIKYLNRQIQVLWHPLASLVPAEHRLNATPLCPSLYDDSESSNHLKLIIWNNLLQLCNAILLIKKCFWTHAKCMPWRMKAVQDAKSGSNIVQPSCTWQSGWWVYRKVSKLENFPDSQYQKLILGDTPDFKMPWTSPFFYNK